LDYNHTDKAGLEEEESEFELSDVKLEFEMWAIKHMSLAA